MSQCQLFSYLKNNSNVCDGSNTMGLKEIDTHGPSLDCGSQQQGAISVGESEYLKKL